jgi:hypothetical protein
MSDEWLEDGSPEGGVATITRPADDPASQPAWPGRPRPATPHPARPRHPGRVPPGSQRGAPPDDRGARSLGDERRGKRADPGAPEATGASTAPGGERGKQSERGKQRLPFFVLLCGLLGGALVCALVISTTLAAGSFQITRLQQADTALARQRQLLQEQVATAQSAQVIESRALQLGMRSAGVMRFLNLKNGKVQTDSGSGAVQDINVPGYTP